MEIPQQQSLQDQDEQVIGLDFRRYLSAIRNYKWIIASIVALAITGLVPLALILGTLPTMVAQAHAGSATSCDFSLDG